MKNKFQIFYQPRKSKRKEIESFSISYYDFDFDSKTYTEKLVLEKGGEKYKIKRCCEGLDELMSILSNIDITTYKEKDDVNMLSEVYCMQCDEHNYSTNDISDIEEILEQIHFYDKLEEHLSEAS